MELGLKALYLITTYSVLGAHGGSSVGVSVIVSVAVGVSVGIQASPAALVDAVQNYLEQGYRRIKIKIARTDVLRRIAKGLPYRFTAVPLPPLGG